MSSPVKRQKLEKRDEEEEDEDEGSVGSDLGSEESGMDEVSTDGDGSDDTDNEIAQAQQPIKSKNTLKRKRRAVGATPFGAALNALLQTPAPSTLPLSLKPSISRKLNKDKLEAKAKKVLLGEKKDREDKGHITDVIGGWGGESERALRKVAQRGVVKLFNVIQQAQSSASASATQVQATRGTGKPTLPAPRADDFGSTKKTKGKGSKSKDNIIGRGKEVTLNPDDFLESIRSGGLVSTS
ncbi:hypothetical protein BOTBODRAFT_124173 [Botryobasidium botryosum FD-172 SS1]|uniref:Rrp15p-domain-containing protein n=1 Tax=Botryobasidium botryosum (strain FD-172 SS1) TaxID=930990 RepID=A0A067N9R8_BOTB1|nr:hypothetical protein BOTBODRAFT_124173 [Botryobasidium botryosum FD-172 SS1]